MFLDELSTRHKFSIATSNYLYKICSKLTIKTTKQRQLNK